MIVHIITGLNRGGAEHALFRLVTREPDPKKVWVVSCKDAGLFGARLTAAGIGVTCLDLHHRFINPIKFWKLVRLLRQLQPDMVQTWMYHADLLGGLAAKLAGVPVCWGVRHSNLSATHNPLTTRLVARLCGILSQWVPARIVFNSQNAISVHQALGYASPAVLIHNGLDAQQWSPRPELRETTRARLGLPEDAFVFAHAGRGDPQKDHPTLARAFSQMLESLPNVWLLMCGSGLTENAPYFKSLPFSPLARRQVLPLGARDDLVELWSAADAFVLSSAYGEGFPNVVAEAMACGLPCVTTDVGDAAAIVGDTGLVVPPSAPDQLEAAMLAMAGLSEAEYRRRANAARLRIEAEFSLDRMFESFHQVWNDAVKERNGGDKLCAG